jgi:hypothetical protein
MPGRDMAITGINNYFPFIFMSKEAWLFSLDKGHFPMEISAFL